jgi:sugar lactone lactonase YvrE
MLRLTVSQSAALFAGAFVACGRSATTESSSEVAMSHADISASAPVIRLWDAIDFDPAKLEYPEGVAFDPRGRLFVGITRLAEVRQIEPDGAGRTIARLLPPEKVPIPAGAPGLLGLATSARGDVYAALVTLDAATQGVYRIDGRTRQSMRIAGTEAICWPNALVFDDRGNLYVTESTRLPCGGDPTVGAVWRIPRGGGADEWIASPALSGTGQLPLPYPIGANGIVFRRGGGGPGTLIVANTERGSLVSIPIEPDGSAGELTMLAQDPRIFTVDGIVAGADDAIYAMVIGQNTIVRVSPNGTAFDLVASGPPLDFPVNAVFGVHGPDRRRLFVVNFALPAFGGTKPGIVVVEP